jgi:hypothetical protein
LIFRNLLLGESMQVERYQRLVCLRFWDELYLSYPEYEDAKSKGTVNSSESFIPGYF